MDNMETGNNDHGGEGAILPAVDTQMKKLLQEKLNLDGYDFPNANRLIDDGM